MREAYNGKTALKNNLLHITLSFQGDAVFPGDYVKYSRLLSTKFPVQIIGYKFNDFCCTAAVELPKELDGVQLPHITLALAPAIRPSYSKKLLLNADVPFIRFQQPLIVETVLSCHRNSVKKDQQKVAGKYENDVKSIEMDWVWPKPGSSRASKIKIASDIGGVIYRTTTAKSTNEHEMKVGTELVRDSFEGIKRLTERGYEVYLLSYCGEKTENETRERLVKDRFDTIVPIDRWLFCRERLLKPTIMRQYGIQLLIDDSDKIINACRQQNLLAIHFGQDANCWAVVLRTIQSNYLTKFMQKLN